MVTQAPPEVSPKLRVKNKPLALLGMIQKLKINKKIKGGGD